MRRSSLVLAIFPLLAACVYMPGLDGGGRSDGFRGTTDEALSVRLHPPAHGFLSFAVSEPAYVAVFEVAPDRGISLLYPYYRDQSENASRSGFNTRTLPWRPRGRWYYASANFQPYFSWQTQPTYLYIIASKFPLRVDELMRSPGSLRRNLGWNTYLATNLSRTLDQLETMVVPQGADEDWSSDIYVMWPQPRMRDTRRLVRVSCPDGSQLLMPGGYNLGVCPTTTNVAQGTRPTTPAPPGGVQRREPGDARPPRPRDAGEAPKVSAGSTRSNPESAERPRPVREEPARLPDRPAAPAREPSTTPRDSKPAETPRP